MSLIPHTDRATADMMEVMTEHAFAHRLNLSTITDLSRPFDGAAYDTVMRQMDARLRDAAARWGDAARRDMGLPVREGGAA